MKFSSSSTASSIFSLPFLLSALSISSFVATSTTVSVNPLPPNLYNVTIINATNNSSSSCFERNIGYNNNEDVSGPDAPVSPFRRPSEEECQKVCKGQRDCYFFSYQREKQLCWLKKSDKGRQQMIGFISGRKCCFLNDVNFNNNDNVPPGNAPRSPFIVYSAAECFDECKKYRECKFFSYREKDQNCWIKTSDAGQESAIGMVSGKKFCDEDTNECKTTEEGPQRNKSCIFPFMFSGTKYHKCIFDDTNDKPWCSTKVDEYGHHVLEEEEYGTCQESCPIIERECRQDSDCKNGSLPHCTGTTCVECKENDHCKEKYKHSYCIDGSFCVDCNKARQCREGFSCDEIYKDCDLDRCCKNLTITSNGWSKYVHGHQLWGDYTKSLYPMNKGKYEYKHNNPLNDKYLYWDEKYWVVSSNSFKDNIYMIHETCNEQCPENCSSAWDTYKLECADNDPNNCPRLGADYRDDNITVSCGHVLHCTNWPTSFDYECQNEEGDDWTLLGDSINTTDECELLCLQNTSDVGCCSVLPGDECYWKGGATVAKAIGDNSSLAVACTYTEPELWKIEENEKWCCEGSSIKVNSSHNGQYKCQNECMKEEDCIGISWSYWEGNGRYCVLCYDDVLCPIGYGLGFYRKAGDTGNSKCDPNVGYNRTCKFPFAYDGKYYYECTTEDNNGTLWCMTTEVDADGLDWTECKSKCNITDAGTTTVSTTTENPCSKVVATATDPKRVMVSNSLTLSCKLEVEEGSMRKEAIRWKECTWTRMSDNAACRQRAIDDYTLAKRYCDDFKENIEMADGKSVDRSKCSITITNVLQTDKDGRWKCKLQKCNSREDGGCKSEVTNGCSREIIVNTTVMPYVPKLPPVQLSEDGGSVQMFVAFKEILLQIIISTFFFNSLCLKI